MLRQIIGTTIGILLALTAVEVCWNEVDYVIYMIIICLILIDFLLSIWLYDPIYQILFAGIISIIMGSYPGWMVFMSDKSDYLLLPIAKGIGAGLLYAIFIMAGLMFVAHIASIFNPE